MGKKKAGRKPWKRRGKNEKLKSRTTDKFNSRVINWTVATLSVSKYICVVVYVF